MSVRFRDEFMGDDAVQEVLGDNEDNLGRFFEALAQGAAGADEESEPGITLGVWLDLCMGKLGGSGWATELYTMPSRPLVGDVWVQRGSAVTGDERCKTKLRCSLSVMQAKRAFLESLPEAAGEDAPPADEARAHSRFHYVPAALPPHAAALTSAAPSCRRSTS